MAAEAGIPNESESAPIVIVPNVKPMVEASILAAANTEAANIRIAARLYLVDNPSTTPLVSEKLWPLYTSGTPKAVYLVDTVTLQIIKVSSSPGGWENIVFSISQLKWLESIPDNDHIEDQDIP